MLHRQIFVVEHAGIQENDNMLVAQRNKINGKAARHLFLWAVLFNRVELAELLWSYTTDHVGEQILICHVCLLIIELIK